MLDTVLWNIVNNTTLSNKYKFLEKVLVREDYIIYYYCQEYSKDDIKLTEISLKSVMNAHKLIWINKVNMLKEREIDREYLQSQTSDKLYSDKDYADILELLVLERFKVLSKCEMLSPEDFESAIKGIRTDVESSFVKKIVTKSFDLISGKMSSINIDGVNYFSLNPIDAVYALTSSYKNSLNNLGSYLTKEQEHNAQLDDASEESSSLAPVFKWNLGEKEKQILPNPTPGSMIAISGPPKEGKTTFVVGEVFYNCIVQGSNACYYAGETQISEIYAKLVVKHLQALYNYDIEVKVAKDIVILHKKILNKTIKPKELIYFNSIDKTYVELVVHALNDLINNDRYGRFTIITPKKHSDRFKMDNVVNDIIADLKSSPKDMRYDAVFLDHINLFKEGFNMGIETFTKELVKLSKNEINQLVIFVINHLSSDDTKRVSKIMDYKQFNDMTFTTHNTRELEKSANLDISIVSTPEQKVDGEVTLKINVCRDKNIIKDFGTTIFPLLVNHNTSTFITIGGQKKPYNEYNVKDDDGCGLTELNLNL